VAKKKQTPKTVKELRIGVVDTMFARLTWARRRAPNRELLGLRRVLHVISRTVPGFKDWPSRR